MQKKVIIRGSVQKFQFFGLDFYLSGAKLGEKNWYILKNICGTNANSKSRKIANIVILLT